MRAVFRDDVHVVLVTKTVLVAHDSFAALTGKSHDLHLHQQLDRLILTFCSR
jgi:hypothetical protein